MSRNRAFALIHSVDYDAAGVGFCPAITSVLPVLNPVAKLMVKVGMEQSLLLSSRSNMIAKNANDGLVPVTFRA